MKREDLFVRMERENNREFIIRSMEDKTRKLTVKDLLIYRINKLILPMGFDRRKDTIALYGDRLGYFVQEISEYYNVISIGGMSSASVSQLWKKDVHVIMYRKWNRRIAEAYIKQDWKAVERELAEIERVFRRNHVKFLIVTDLYPVIQRALCLVAKKLNIPIAYYEHTSIINLKEDVQMCEFYQNQAKDYTDFFWFWSEKNKDDIVARNIAREEQSTIIGYPYKIDRRDIEKKKSVIWIGDGETHHSEKPEIFYNLVEQVFEYCQEKGIDFTYRPHPKEKKHFYRPLADRGMKLSKNSLAEDLEGNYIVIGGKTTVLMEAGLYEDVVFQILWDEKKVGLFLFDNAYVLQPEINSIINHISMALKGKTLPKPVEEYSLARLDLKKVTKAAIERNIRQYEGKE